MATRIISRNVKKMLLYSDLHLDYGRVTDFCPESAAADILVLAGDIIVFG